MSSATGRDEDTFEPAAKKAPKPLVEIWEQLDRAERCKLEQVIWEMLDRE